MVFCQDWKDWTPEMWERVLWSDETATPETKVQRLSEGFQAHDMIRAISWQRWSTLQALWCEGASVRLDVVTYVPSSKWSRVGKDGFKSNLWVLSPWPGNSQDVNPLENLRSILKRKLVQHNPTSLQHLQEVICDVWCREIDPETCKRLVHNISQWVRQVLKNKGRATKYWHCAYFHENLR